jgi:formamidopyrimidine-DNA glycosylase
MPELPEVETTRRGIEPYLTGARIKDIIIRQRKLRWPIPRQLEKELTGQQVRSVTRRGKYLLLNTDSGTAIIHLGMSGSLQIIKNNKCAGPHDHVDLQLNNKTILRFTDPRRFGCLLWTRSDPLKHKLLRNLGPEPLSDNFNSDYIFKQARGRKLNIKAFLMNSHIVVGVGNIYANESLFMAGIHPKRAAGRISLHRYQLLVDAVKEILKDSIKLGGTTLKDFVDSNGKPGYFQQTLRVYGRGGEPCKQCSNPLKEIRLGQRSTIYCTNCQH